MAAAGSVNKYSMEDYKSLITRVGELEKAVTVNSVFVRNFPSKTGEANLDCVVRFLLEVLRIPKEEMSMDALLSVTFVAVGCYKIKISERFLQVCLKYSKKNLNEYNKGAEKKVSFYREKTRTELANLDLSRWLLEQLRKKEIHCRMGALSADIFCEIGGVSKFHRPEVVARHFGVVLEDGKKEVVERRKATKRKVSGDGPRVTKQAKSS